MGAHAAFGYYFDHREEIDGELAAEPTALERADEQPASPLRLSLIAACRDRERIREGR